MNLRVENCHYPLFVPVGVPLLLHIKPAGISELRMEAQVMLAVSVVLLLLGPRAADPGWQAKFTGKPPELLRILMEKPCNFFFFRDVGVRSRDAKVSSTR